MYYVTMALLAYRWRVEVDTKATPVFPFITAAYRPRELLTRKCSARTETGVRTFVIQRFNDEYRGRNIEVVNPDIRQRDDVRVRVRLDRTPDSEDKTHVCPS